MQRPPEGWARPGEGLPSSHHCPRSSSIAFFPPRQPRDSPSQRQPRRPRPRRVRRRKRRPGPAGGRGLAALGQWDGRDLWGGARTAGALRPGLGQVPNLRPWGAASLSLGKNVRACLPSCTHAATARAITRARRAPRFLEGGQRGKWDHVPLGTVHSFLPALPQGVLYYCHTVHTDASHPAQGRAASKGDVVG